MSINRNHMFSIVPLFKTMPKIIQDIQRISEARVKKKINEQIKIDFEAHSRKNRERVPRHFLGSPRGKWLRVTDRPRESSFPRCEIERWPGPKNDQRQIFRALCSLPAIQRDPKRVEGERRGWSVKGGGQTSYLLGPFPFAITISAPLSVPIRFLSAPYRFAFDTQTVYAHVARVENGGRQFLSLRSKDSSLIVIFQRRRRKAGKYRVLVKISASILDNRKILIKRHEISFLDFSFLFFLSFLGCVEEEAKAKSRTMSREESCAFF